MPCRIYKLDFQEKILNLDRDLYYGGRLVPIVSRGTFEHGQVWELG